MFKLLLLQDSYAYLPSVDYLALIDRLMQGQRVTHLHLLASPSLPSSWFWTALTCQATWVSNACREKCCSAATVQLQEGPCAVQEQGMAESVLAVMSWYVQRVLPRCTGTDISHADLMWHLSRDER